MCLVASAGLDTLGFQGISLSGKRGRVTLLRKHAVDTKLNKNSSPLCFVTISVSYKTLVFLDGQSGHNVSLFVRL